MIDLADLFRLFDEFQRVTGMPETTLSHRIFRESKKITLLRDGGGLTIERYNHTLLWMDRNWPEGAKWPSQVFRPEQMPSAEPTALAG